MTTRKSSRRLNGLPVRSCVRRCTTSKQPGKTGRHYCRERPWGGRLAPPAPSSLDQPLPFFAGRRQFGGVGADALLDCFLDGLAHGDARQLEVAGPATAVNGE